MRRASRSALRSRRTNRLADLPSPLTPNSPFETELWLTERQTEYRLFGFVSSLMERVPLIGLAFSISNRMYVLLPPLLL